MYRSSKTAAFTLVETMVALAITAIVVSVVGSYLGQFQRSYGYSERRAAAWTEALQAGSIVQTMMARRNISLDSDESRPAKSIEVVSGATPELRILARQKSDSHANQSINFHNVCRARPEAAPPPPTGAPGRCAFTCPEGQASSVVMTVSAGGSLKSRTIVGASERASPGAISDAVLCLIPNRLSSPAAPEVSFEVLVRFYDASGKGYESSETVAESLSLSIRDRNVEMTGNE